MAKTKKNLDDLIAVASAVTRTPAPKTKSITPATFQDRFEAIVDNMEKAVKGKRDVLRMVLVAVLSEGHILLEDMPGTGKTTLARALAKSINCVESRIQCTPDLLPSDVTGSPFLDMQTREFTFRAGPVFANVVLVDEINRATPKTQSSLLEAMQERSVTVDGVTHPLPRPFVIIATQNPIELAGTFPLPEAQLDRFLFKISMGYPSRDAMSDVLDTNSQSEGIDQITPVIDAAELLEMAAWARGVAVGDAVKMYAIDLVEASRADSSLLMGAGPRAALALHRSARVLAASNGREDAYPDDVKLVLEPVLAHRCILTPDASLRDETVLNVVERIVGRVKAPVRATSK